MEFIEAMSGVLERGSNLIINPIQPDHLLRLALIAKANGGKLTVVGGIAYDQMLSLAEAGGAAVTISLAKYPNE